MNDSNELNTKRGHEDVSMTTRRLEKVLKKEERKEKKKKKKEKDSLT
jgi:hypothetical protein